MTIPPPPVNLPPRPVDAHKGAFGLTLIIGGSRGMAGAVALAGMAALRGGAGLTRLAVPDVCLETVAAFEPSYMTVPLPCDTAGRISLVARDTILDLADAATVVACGPGLGRSMGMNALVRSLYSGISSPMVVDADALNALAGAPNVLAQPGGPRILTPHAGEFARLVQGNQASAEELAKRCGAIVVLKGHRTIITNGDQTTVNRTGNPGMATGGSGDVLTGLIASLVSQNLSPFDAAQLGVYLHGLAGDLAAERLGQESLIASDLVEALPEAFAILARSASE